MQSSLQGVLGVLMQLSSTDTLSKAYLSDPNEVSMEATASRSIGVEGMKLWKVIEAIVPDEEICLGLAAFIWCTVV